MAGHQALYIETPRGLFERQASARALRALHGFEFVAEGEAINDPAAAAPAQLWIFDPREQDGMQLDGFTLKVRRMAISWPAAPLRFEREWLEGERVLDLPHVTRGGATPADYRRLADAYQALIRFTENERIYLGGRRKLAESPTSEWRWFADQGIEMLRNEPTLSIKDAAVRLNLARSDELIDMDDEDEGRFERAAEKRLRRWIKSRKEELRKQAGK